MDRREAFRVLASADRQLVLHELLERDGRASIPELSRQVAARRHRLVPEKLSDEERRRARIRLIHTHLPRMEEADVIDIVWDDTEIVLNDAEVDKLFEAAEELDNWPPNDLLGRRARRR
ncbi:DUF7344 domain-containing protein [Haloterrigena alkaliphila]|uniref:DUF7344 domain-containing protein n=1 Tax=Haloterrigena alkaliphila TaxID=2816475 RepID=A0A8A2VFU9_9EURY|nr:hypothetical protein [Haloterrigena alkaliphila]QSW99232.1 hypothetical protein J0X25_17935 [Haloterrigena alkaliphila]